MSVKSPPRPNPKSSVPIRHTLSYQLREVIDARGLSAYAVGQLAGVDPGVVSRFLTGKRDLLLGTADRIALALGVRLVEVARKGRPPGRVPSAAASSVSAVVSGAEDGSGPDADVE